MDLKPCTLTLNAIFLNGYPGNGEDLPDKKEAQTGILAVSPFEDLSLLLNGNSHAVVLKDHEESRYLFPVREGDLRYFLPVQEYVFYKVEKDIFQERIGIDLQIIHPDRPGNLQ